MEAIFQKRNFIFENLSLVSCSLGKEERKGGTEEHKNLFIIPRAFSEGLTLHCYTRWLKLNSVILCGVFVLFFFLISFFSLDMYFV